MTNRVKIIYGFRRQIYDVYDVYMYKRKKKEHLFVLIIIYRRKVNEALRRKELRIKRFYNIYVCVCVFLNEV